MNKMNVFRAAVMALTAIFCVSAGNPSATSDEIAMTRCSRAENEDMNVDSSQDSCPTNCEKPKKKRSCKRCREPDSPCPGNRNRSPESDAQYNKNRDRQNN